MNDIVDLMLNPAVRTKDGRAGEAVRIEFCWADGALQAQALVQIDGVEERHAVASLSREQA